ncbi:Pyruvate/ketoisovalerate oxidoreductase [Desulfarculus baarsii DSM 2075]|uniref:Pyruvate/ketoisovalerate oxidoreductase n=1 Tax=Desulfarculus baarsii (strain ATCC 33931 / DSM 2075 / LMG 7858 / VKM B-1802 / 2st14) TaxID=644282 RepID=E1QL51_DESB2|nr:2-oxoacid:acceptor oxidoreductase family protein [Desulfarculus baarsii]ADK85316.1 Pyruvate/ketoisovalerate oxidoreductase [Desulfarculus baarsii DSM 2075]
MYFDCIIAGFGGQGVMLMGNMLAYAAMEAGKHVTYMPVYGVEMRGGTANCTVVVSERPVGSPIIHEPLTAAVMNRPSAEKFGPRVKKQGHLLVNSSLVEEEHVSSRAKNVTFVPTMELAKEVGNPRLGNMVMLGALVQVSKVLEVRDVIKALPKALDPRYHGMIPINTDALKRGAGFMLETLGKK